MCGLFGFSIYGDSKKDYSELIQALAEQASERGMHATGIAFTYKKNVQVFKKPLPAYKIKFKHLNNAPVVTGHTRHATQGKATDNYNNHPFKGVAGQLDFAIAHNGVLYNDDELRKSEKLPATKIKTDSYIYAQLLEKGKKLDFKSIKQATEKLQGYYTFTILNGKNELFIVKGDSPLSLIKLTRLQMYIYASTDSILYKAIIDAGLFDEIKKGYFEEFAITDGDILKINSNGAIEKSHFEMPVYKYTGRNWYNWDSWDDWDDWETATDTSYYEDVVTIAKTQGYTTDEIDSLLADGFTLEDIEEYLYTGAI